MSIGGGMDKEDTYVCVCVCVCVCVYIYMEYYLAIKRNKTMPIAEMWVNLETIMQT